MNTEYEYELNMNIEYIYIEFTLITLYFILLLM